jgi:hypothetical protein
MSHLDERGTNVSYAEPLIYARVASRVRVSLAVVVLGAFLFALQATPAFAGQARVFTGSFGGASSTTADPYPLSLGTGAAVDDATHDVYVSDSLGHRVEKFGPAGEFILMFGKEVNLTKVLASAPESEQDVCTVASFDTCQAGKSTSSPGGFGVGVYVAVDNSVGESKGDVYVADVGGRVSKFDSSGKLVSSWGDHLPADGQLTGVNIKGAFIKGPFGSPVGIAVDTTGNLWVGDGGNRQMLEFRQDSSFVTGWEKEGLGGASGIAVDSKDNLYVNQGFGSPLKFDSAGNIIGFVLQYKAGSSWGLAVDPSDDNLFLDVEPSGSPYGTRVIQRYDSSCRPNGKVLSTPEEIRCTPVESFGTAHLYNASGLAVDPSTSADTLYAVERGQVAVFAVETVPDVSTSKATGFTSTSATLNGSVNPSGIELKLGLEGCRFEWGETEAYGHVVPCDKTSGQIGSGSSPVEVSASVAGLQQGRTYHFRLVAGNANDVNSLIDEPTLGADLAFGPPAVESVSAVGVAANSATVHAQVNPNNVDTRVRLEYGTEAGAYSHSTPQTELGAVGTGELVSFPLSGLVPHTVYHYRVVAENALGEGTQATLSADYVFVTQTAAAGFALPDGRGWELVSPANKHGAALLPISEYGVIQASAMGDAVSYLATAPTEDEPAGGPYETQLLSRRTVNGWESQDISVSHESSVGAVVGQGAEYRLFSSDLSSGVVQPFGLFDPRLSSEASEQTAFLRTNFPSGGVDSPCLTSCYRPLVTGAPGFENVPFGTTFGCSDSNICGPWFVGASQDLSHIVLRSGAVLTEGAPLGEGGVGRRASLYEWSGGSLVLVSILPNRQPAPVISEPTFGEREVGRNAISADGSRVVWSDNKQHLYVRDSVREETVQVGLGAVSFQSASSVGSKILFTEGDGNHGDLRECVIVESGGELHCEVTDLTPVGAGETPGVLGLISGSSADGSYVYFVADAALNNNGVVVSGAQPGGCVDGQNIGGVTCNLYVRHNGTIKLVAEISNNDGPDWGLGDGLHGLVARVSPDGRWLEFMSDRSLTGYDNRDVVTGKPDEEVYLYDALADGGEGRVVCASCDPTGARPHGNEYARLEVAHGGLSIENVGFDQHQGIAANVSGLIPTTGLGEASFYEPRDLSDSGRVFFDSSDALIPQDSNGTGDVYEFEPTGVGNCTSSSTTFSQASDGCLGLISSGTSREESALLDAGESGNDVFFLTYSQLSHGDTDSILDVYDARVGGGFPEAPLPPVCEGDACQSPVSAPEDPTPGSLTYSGPGNPSAPAAVTVAGKQKVKAVRAQRLARALALCRRVRSKRAHTACVMRARKRYGGSKAGVTARRGAR